MIINVNNILDALWTELDDAMALVMHTFDCLDDASIRYMFDEQRFLHRFLAEYSVPKLKDVYEGVPMARLEFLVRAWTRVMRKVGSDDVPVHIRSICRDGPGTERGGSEDRGDSGHITKSSHSSGGSALYLVGDPMRVEPAGICQYPRRWD